MKTLTLFLTWATLQLAASACWMARWGNPATVFQITATAVLIYAMFSGESDEQPEENES